MAETSENSATNTADKSSIVNNAEKTIIAKGVSGTVKWFNVKSGYGFAHRADTNEDLFIHQSSIIKNNPKKARKSVGENENILFDVAEGPKGKEAVNVTGPNGVAVEGSRYARNIGDRQKRYRNYSQSSQKERSGPPRNNRDAIPRGGRGRPMRRPYYGHGQVQYSGRQSAYMDDQSYHPYDNYYGNRYNNDYYGPPQGPGNYYHKDMHMEPYRGQGRRGRGRGRGRGGRSQERYDNAHVDGSGDQQNRGSRRGKGGPRKRRSTNKSESENDKLANNMEKMNLNGPNAEVSVEA